MPAVLNLTARGRRRAGVRTAPPAGKVVQSSATVIGTAAAWLVARLR